MLVRFEQNIKKQNLFSANDKILATVSGGVDSVVLCYLLKLLNFNFEIAHCNFQLRKEDADRDEQFVKQLAIELGIQYHLKLFETDKYSKENGVSIQMAARELRYTWFDELKKEFGFKYILTAHHKNDNVETVLLNLVRGTSHKGLMGIAAKNNDLVRPLLPFTKEEIIQFAKENKIDWREDISNKSNKYKRNLIRNKVIPLLEELNPNFLNTFSENIERFKEESKVINSTFNIHCSTFDIQKIKTNVSPLLTIWNWIEQYGFTFSDAKDILMSLEGIPGKKFISKTYQIVKDREKLLLEKLRSNNGFEKLIIEREGVYKVGDWKLEVKKTKSVNFGLGENVAFLSADKLKFPLTIRKWTEGDKFQPLGMKGMKKVSDFLIDAKVSLHEKENQFVLVSGNKITWLVGKRIDERFKAVEQSNFRIEFTYFFCI